MFECQNYTEEWERFAEKIFFGKNNGNLQGLKKLFQKNDVEKLNEFGKFLKECWEKRAFKTLLQEILQR